MSSAILYLAIVAIWAGFLVPAWVRRPHAIKAGSEAEDLAVDDLDDEVADTDATDTQEYRDEVPIDAVPTRARLTARIGANRAAHQDARQAPAVRAPDRPSQSREQMLRARRRMLTILVTLTLVTGSYAILGPGRWWICVPPAAMLVLYVLLLREIAMADSEHAHKLHEQSVRQARHRAAQARRAAEATATEAETTAQIIDISARIGDQLYDQYADATVRAVGD